MKNFSKTQIKAIETRIAALELELEDQTCQKFPAARAQVTAELAREMEKLGR